MLGCTLNAIPHIEIEKVIYPPTRAKQSRSATGRLPRRCAVRSDKRRRGSRLPGRDSRGHDIGSPGARSAKQSQSLRMLGFTLHEVLYMGGVDGVRKQSQSGAAGTAALADCRFRIGDLTPSAQEHEMRWEPAPAKRGETRRPGKKCAKQSQSATFGYIRSDIGCVRGNPLLNGRGGRLESAGWALTSLWPGPAVLCWSLN
jgi:hypothetical protein